MKEIVIISDHSNRRLLAMLRELFPECELRVIPRSKMPKDGSFRHPNLSASRRDDFTRGNS